MKNVILLLMLVSIFCSCKEQPKRLDKNPIIIYGDSILQNYSYKGYDICPFAYKNYSIPFNIGDEWLVMYNKNRGGSSVIEKHWIADTISLYSPFAFEGMFVTVPIFDDGSICDEGYLDVMYILNGFETFNTHLAEDLQDSYITSRSGMRYEIANGKNYHKKYATWRRKETDYYYTDILFEENGLNEIIYSDGSKEQVLIRNYSKRKWMEKYRIHQILDIDGDGLGDLIVRTYGSIVEPDPKNGNLNIETYFVSDLLFLSSEAEEDELLKHVATKTVTYDKEVIELE